MYHKASHVINHIYYLRNSGMRNDYLFKAKTMEELKQIAESKEVMQKMVVTLAKLSEEEEIRQQCEAREKNEMDMRSCFMFGVEQGIEQGKELGRESMIMTLLREGNITLEVAADKLGKNVNEVKEMLENM